MHPKTMITDSRDSVDIFSYVGCALRTKTDKNRDEDNHRLRLASNQCSFGGTFCPFFRVFKLATCTPFKAKFRGEGAEKNFQFSSVSQ